MARDRRGGGTETRGRSTDDRIETFPSRTVRPTLRIVAV